MARGEAELSIQLSELMSIPGAELLGPLPAVPMAMRGFSGVEPAAGDRLSSLLKFYIYGCLNRVRSSRRLEREVGRKLEVMWLLGRLIRDDRGARLLQADGTPWII